MSRKERKHKRGGRKPPLQQNTTQALLSREIPVKRTKKDHHADVKIWRGLLLLRYRYKPHEGGRETRE